MNGPRKRVYRAFRRLRRQRDAESRKLEGAGIPPVTTKEFIRRVTLLMQEVEGFRPLK